jgi:Winged helix DNA-binding domain
LARLYFKWIGPATAAEFQAFAAIGAKAAKAAIEPLNLKIINNGDERLILPEQYDEFAGFKVPKQAQYVLTSSLDGILLLRRNVKTLLAPEDYGKSVAGERAARRRAVFWTCPTTRFWTAGGLSGFGSTIPKPSPSLGLRSSARMRTSKPRFARWKTTCATISAMCARSAWTA